jgi:uncharacterized protein
VGKSPKSPGRHEIRTLPELGTAGATSRLEPLTSRAGGDCGCSPRATADLGAGGLWELAGLPRASRILVPTRSISSDLAGETGLLDAGVIVALLDRSERQHARCTAVVEELERPLATCEAVIAESCYLLRRVSGAAEIILENVERGVFHVPFQLAQSSVQVRAILRKYRDVPADFADACLIHLASQLNTGDILTLDRDFESYRWNRTRPSHLLVNLKE